MSIDKYDYGLNQMQDYDYLDKKTNVRNHAKYMLAKMGIMFMWHNLPDTIPQRNLEQLLQVNGFCIIADVEGKLYALQGTGTGDCNAYYEPKQVLVSNPWLKLNKTYTIDEDCILIPNDTFFLGIYPMISKYATLLNENEMTMLLANVNKRIQTYIAASDNPTIESAKLFLKQIFEGKQGIIADEKLFESLKFQQIANTSRTMQDLFEYHQYLKASFYNEFGLSANFNMKRERLTQNEIETNSDNLYPFVDNMLYCRQNAIDKINEMFGTDISIEFNSSWDYRAYNGENISFKEMEELKNETRNELGGNEGTGGTKEGRGQEEQEEKESGNSRQDSQGNDGADSNGEVEPAGTIEPDESAGTDSIESTHDESETTPSQQQDTREIDKVQSQLSSIGGQGTSGEDTSQNGDTLQDNTDSRLEEDEP